MKEENTQSTPEKDHRLDRGDLWYILLLLAVVFLANYRLVFSQETYHVLGDIGHDFERALSINQRGINDTLRKGYFPLWINTTSFGFPPISSHLYGAFFPTSPFLLALLPYPSGFIFMLLSQYILLSIFSYLFFRRIGLSGPAAFFAGAWMTLGGNTIRMSLVWPFMNSLIAFFFCMWAITGLIKGPDLKKIILSAIGGCLFIFSGDVEFTVYFLYFGTLWFLIYGLSLLSYKQLLKIILAFLSAAIVLALILSAVQLLPSTFFFSQCVRSEPISLLVYKSSFGSPLTNLLGSLGALFRKSPNFYFGIIPLGLCLLGIVKSRRHPAAKASVVLLLVMAAIIYCFSLGVYKILYHLPYLSVFVRHFQFFNLFQFSLLILSGFGVDELRKSDSRPVIIIGLFIIGIIEVFLLPGVIWKCLAALAMAGILAGMVFKKRIVLICLVILTLIDIFSFLWHTPYKLRPFSYWQVYTDLVSGTAGEARNIAMYPAVTLKDPERDSSLPVQTGGIEGGDAMNTFLSFPLRSTAMLYNAIIPNIHLYSANPYTQLTYFTVFQSTDFFKISNRHLVNLTNLRYIFCEDMALKEAERRPILSDPGYNITPPWINKFEPYTRELMKKDNAELPVMSINKSGEFHYESLFDSGCLLRFSIFFKSEKDAHAEFRLTWQSPDGTHADIYHHQMALSDSKGQAVAGPFDIPLYTSTSGEGVLSFKVDIGGGDATATWINPVIINHNKTLRWIAGEGRLMAFENIEALPRARIVHEYIATGGDEEAAEIMMNRSFYDPVKQVVLDRHAPGIAIETPTIKDSESATIIEYNQNYLIMEAKLEQPGWMILSETYYPGWRAFIDGKEQRIYRADLAFRGLLLEPGRHQILFQFEPLDFRIGLWTSITSILSIFLILVLRHFSKPGKPDHE